MKINKAEKERTKVLIEKETRNELQEVEKHLDNIVEVVALAADKFLSINEKL